MHVLKTINLQHQKYLNNHVNLLHYFTTHVDLLLCVIIFPLLRFKNIIFMISILVKLIRNLQPSGMGFLFIAVILLSSKVLSITGTKSFTNIIYHCTSTHVLQRLMSEKTNEISNSDHCTTCRIHLSSHRSSSTPIFVLAALYMSSLNLYMFLKYTFALFHSYHIIFLGTIFRSDAEFHKI